MSMQLELMLKSVMEDLSTIKAALPVIARLDEKTNNINSNLTRVVNRLDDHERRLNKYEMQHAGKVGVQTGNSNFVKWITALISALLIAMYLNNSKPVQGAVLQKEIKVVILEPEKRKPKD